MREALEVFHPVEFINDELKERKWTEKDLTNTSGLTEKRVRAILNHDLITRKDALGLSRAFGTSPTLWLNLQKIWYASFENMLEEEARKIEKP